MKFNRKWREILSDFCVNLAAGLAFAAFAVSIGSNVSLSQKAILFFAYIVLGIVFLVLAYKIKHIGR